MEIALDYRDRPDPFSSFKSGFEIRTTRLCEQVRMLHRFIETGPEPLQVTATQFEYESRPTMTYLTSVTRVGCRSGAAMPPVTFEYSRSLLKQQTFHTIFSRQMS